MVKLVIFDLDGTLLYTLESISVNVNKALAEFGYPEIPLNDYKYLVGNAADYLIHGALKKVGAPDEEFTQVRAAYQKYFEVGCNYHVQPYDQVKDLLKALSKRGIACAVFTNKQHELAQEVIREHFGDGAFAYVQGQEPDLPRKPDPMGVSRICEKVGVDLSEVLYLGDSDVDMKTGLGAGVMTIGALWGYRTEEELSAYHPAGLIHTPLELLQYVESTVIWQSDVVIEHKDYTGSLSAKALHEDGRPYHTFRTASVLVVGDRVTFRNCRFENTAGKGADAGQALALYLDGDDIVLEDCVLKGHQDTLFLAPLPPKEYEKDGFLGPKQFSPRTPRSVTFRNCLIEGGVDFIFGGASAVFEACEFKSIEPGYVFAPSTPKEAEAGFIARHCRFTCSDDIPDASCYIARPWREYAKMRIEQCELGRHIHPAGWDDWGKTEAHATVCFEETGSFGPGKGGIRPDYVHVSE